MSAGIRENGTEEGDKVVRSVLAARHNKELDNLESQYAAQKKIMVDDAISKLNEKYDKRREDLTRRQEKELADLQVRL